MTVRVKGAVVDPHGGNESDKVEDDEERDEPGIPASTAGAGLEEGGLVLEEVLFFVFDADGECGGRRWLDFGLRSGGFRFLCHCRILI